MIVDKYEKMPVIQPLPYPQPWYKRIWCDRLWGIAEDWYFHLPNGDKIVIYDGFVSDGASVPLPFRILLHPLDGLFLPALPHDFAYRHNKLIGVGLDTDGNEFRYDYHAGAGRAYWDDMFSDLALSCKGVFVTTVKDQALTPVCWAFMRTFGWKAWNRYRRLEKRNALIREISNRTH